MRRTKFTINESTTPNYPSTKELAERIKFRRHARNFQSVDSKKEEQQNQNTNIILSTEQPQQSEILPPSSSSEKYKKFKGRFTKNKTANQELNKINLEEEKKEDEKKEEKKL